MSQYGLIYRLEFQNIKEQLIRVDIYPTDILIPDADTPVITPLKGTGNPFTVTTVNNDEDKMQTIRSKQAKIEFKSDSGAGLNISTFSISPDNLWRVDASVIGGETIFKGYLMLADNQQPFLPDPNVVTLTATDHLGAIKEIAWVDYDGINPIGKYRIADIICQCLKQTGLDLPLFVINNLKAGTGVRAIPGAFTAVDKTFSAAPTSYFYKGQTVTISGTTSNNGTFTVRSVTPGALVLVVFYETIVDEVSASASFSDDNSLLHWYDGVYLDAKTFEKIIGQSLSCYEVLERILGQDSFITQWQGNWWVMRVDEFDDTASVLVAEFTSVGVYVTTTTEVIEKSIGRTEDTKFANADTLLRFIRPHDHIRETFNYNFPLETPCNSNFSRGTLDTTVSAYEKWYELECWTKRRGVPGAYNTPITITDFIKRIFNLNSYETERYIFITPQTGHVGFSSTDDEYIESEAIPVLIQDKFTMSIDWKLNVALTTSSASPRLFRAILAGEDGSYWILGEATVGDGIPVWYNTSGFTVNTGKGATGIVFSSGINTLEWQNISWEAPPIPVSGNLFIWIGQFYQSSTTGVNTTVNYDNLRFDYIPFVNGGYATYTGQYNQATRLAPGFMPRQENEVYISDSPFPLAKGSMLVPFGVGFALVGNWYDSHTFAGGSPPNDTYYHPFGWFQVYAVMNQFRGTGTTRANGMNIFQGSVYGFGDVWPDMLQKYSLTDTNPETNDKFFMLISFTQDWKSCQMSIVVVETYNYREGRVYTDAHTFKYIQE